ncbi:hypothetical protein P7H21_25160 [Paenibacillus larvae]|nr:hypothetical protein [Paenibacillus larvae]MDT2306581.1 hypothetical protein [Paenibacillus larvae]
MIYTRGAQSGIRPICPNVYGTSTRVSEDRSGDWGILSSLGPVFAELGQAFAELFSTIGTLFASELPAILELATGLFKNVCGDGSSGVC